MTQPPRRYKGAYDDWLRHLDAERAANEIDAVGGLQGGALPRW